MEDGGWRMEDGGSLLYPPSSILYLLSSSAPGQSRAHRSALEEPPFAEQEDEPGAGEPGPERAVALEQRSRGADPQVSKLQLIDRRQRSFGDREQAHPDRRHELAP